jgi:hypothetical protein
MAFDVVFTLALKRQTLNSGISPVLASDNWHYGNLWLTPVLTLTISCNVDTTAQRQKRHYDGFKMFLLTMSLCCNEARHHELAGEL